MSFRGLPWLYDLPSVTDLPGVDMASADTSGSHGIALRLADQDPRCQPAFTELSICLGDH